MIYDKINNIKVYAGLSTDITIGLDYLITLDPAIADGIYQITPNVKTIVSEYETKRINENGFEAHIDYIVIQYLLFGEEIIKCKPIEELKLTKPYVKDSDIAFYSDYASHPAKLKIGNGYFAILYSNDGHEPCICLDAPSHVKKVVLKIKIVNE